MGRRKRKYTVKSLGAFKNTGHYTNGAKLNERYIFTFLCLFPNKALQFSSTVFFKIISAHVVFADIVLLHQLCRGFTTVSSDLFCNLFFYYQTNILKCPFSVIQLWSLIVWALNINELSKLLTSIFKEWVNTFFIRHY